MNFTQSIINNAINISNKKLTILLVDNEKKEFINFLKQLDHKFIYFNDLYFGGNIPNLILCNNKIDYYHQCKELSIRFHIPSIIVDHNIKNDVYDENKIKFFDNLPCSTKVAINIPIFKSWNSIHDKILPYAIDNIEYLESWSKLLNEISNREFII